MPIINPDTSRAEDFSPLSGTYKAKVVGVEFKNSKKGNPMIVVDLAVEVPGSAKVRDRKAFLVITGAGAMGFDQFLRATGFSKEADAYRDPSVPNPDFDTDSLIGCELQCNFEKRTYTDDMGQMKVGDQITTYLKQ